MKNRVSVRAKLFRCMALAVLAAVAAVAALQNTSPQGYKVTAECTRAGTASYGLDGKPVCDCTGPNNGGNCSCIVKCPSSGGDDGGGVGGEEGGS